MIIRFAVPFSLLFSVSAMAQEASPVARPETEAAIDVSDESEWQDLGIAIPAFATNADVPTQTNAGSTGALGSSVAQIITADLRNNGLFKPVGPESLPRPGYDQVQAPDFPVWQGAAPKCWCMAMSAPIPMGS